MHNLSEHISKMNNLKDKIISVSNRISQREHNMFQNKHIKALSQAELNNFIKFRELVCLNQAHFEITNINKKKIFVKLIWAGNEYFPYEENPTSVLKTYFIELNNIWGVA